MKGLFQKIESNKVGFLFMELELASLKKELSEIETTPQNLVWKKQLVSRLLQMEEKLVAHKGYLTWIEYWAKRKKVKLFNLTKIEKTARVKT